MFLLLFVGGLLCLWPVFKIKESFVVTLCVGHCQRTVRSSAPDVDFLMCYCFSVHNLFRCAAIWRAFVRCRELKVVRDG